jgi:hypothetical protein
MKLHKEDKIEIVKAVAFFNKFIVSNLPVKCRIGGLIDIKINDTIIENILFLGVEDTGASILIETRFYSDKAKHPSMDELINFFGNDLLVKIRSALIKDTDEFIKRDKRHLDGLLEEIIKETDVEGLLKEINDNFTEDSHESLKRDNLRLQSMLKEMKDKNIDDIAH